MAAESATARLARLLLLVPWLKANPGITIAEAANAHRVSVTQMMSDLAELYTTEVPGMFSEGMLDIAYCRSDFSVDGDCRIYVRDARKLDHPTRLAAEQVSQLIVAIDAARVSWGQSDPHLATARAKLVALLPDAQLTPTHAVRVEARSADEVVALVTRALESDLVLQIDYLSGGSDAVSSRVIEPVAMRAEADKVLVAAWCQSAQDWRTFRADRVTAAGISTEPARRPDDMGPASFQPGIDFPIEVHAHVAAGSRWVVEDLPAAAIIGHADGTCDVTFRAGSADWVARWALRFADRVSVTAPRAAVDLAQARARKLLELLADQPLG